MKTSTLKILVPMDGSEAALRAMDTALTLGAELHLVNVQQAADDPGALMHWTAEKLHAHQTGIGKSQLDAACQVLDRAGAQYTTHVLIGSEPAQEIAALAESGGFNLIIMGTRGMSALGNLLLGSTATQVVHLTRVPVTLVK